MVLVAASLGVLDAAIGANWDLVVLFGVIAIVAAVDVVRSTSRRAPIRLRSDLVAWMDRRAAAHGERVEDVADRAVAAFRAGIVGNEDA